MPAVSLPLYLFYSSVKLIPQNFKIWNRYEIHISRFIESLQIWHIPVHSLALTATVLNYFQLQHDFTERWRCSKERVFAGCGIDHLRASLVTPLLLFHARRKREQKGANFERKGLQITQIFLVHTVYQSASIKNLGWGIQTRSAGLCAMEFVIRE